MPGTLVLLPRPRYYTYSHLAGANDVANSFATSVSSRSLTMKQAMMVAAVCEFSGSVTVGSRVADTIRSKIVDPYNYSSQPSVLLLAMMCTIIGSSLFLTFATRHGMPMSTTHSVIGGLVGTATASIGIDKINWGWDGVSQVFAAWVIAPGIAGCMGALLFFVTKRFILTRPGAVKRAFYSIPFYTFLTVAALTSKIICPSNMACANLGSAHLLERIGEHAHSFNPRRHHRHLYGRLGHHTLAGILPAAVLVD